MGFEQSFNAVSELVKNFRSNEKYYTSPDYQEVDVRKDFIDKFFIALGWDVNHDIQQNPYEQEVHVERRVIVAKAQKRADYSFYLKPNFRDVKFFVEAKKPSRNLQNADDFFQTVRYGWNASTPIAILTDFEEFIILDCRFRPDIGNIIESKIMSSHYTDYLDEEKFRLIYHLFSYESVADGSIEKYAEDLPKPKKKDKQKRIIKRAYQSIDEAFLEELDTIRLSLAKAFKKTNQHLTSEELTEAAQRVIDRLVFIRFLEDKLIEPHHYLSEFGKRKSAWEDFISVSRTLDAKYNGIVFKKHQIDSQNIFDPDDKTFSLICDDLSHNNSPYDFDKIPIHILGSIYERFLGKTVEATDKRVRIEEKPEVRKAGGVYYTPQYIVNYIVDNTGGKLIEGKTPKQISKMRFADIACGSGSFLITVFDKLLEHHKKYYQANPEQAKKDGCVLLDEVWRLTLSQKQKILLNNIYGVDIDQQAVEVTQLSLYLKLLEDETTATANDTWVLFKEQLLPNLNKNIICGNSLIGTDILSNDLFDFSEEKKLKPMDFENVFPEVMSKGGFDAIVGNPPYIKIQNLQEFSNESVSYLKEKYYSAQKGNYDLYVVFVEKAKKLLNSEGVFGYILPHKFFNSGYGQNLREIIIRDKLIHKIVHFNDYQVFKNATTYTCLLFLNKKNGKEFSAIKVDSKKFNPNDLTDLKFQKMVFDEWENKEWNISSRKESDILLKFKDYKTLAEITSNIFQGPKAGADNVFIFQLIRTNNKKAICYSKTLEKEFEIELGILKKYIKGKHIKRYIIDYRANDYTLYPYNKLGELYTYELLKEKFPLAFQYLNEPVNKKILLDRENGRFSKIWWSYSRPQNMRIIFNKKILTPFNAFHNSFSYDINGDFVFSAGVSGAYGILLKDTFNMDYRYLLALLNSQLSEFIIRNISTALRGGFYSYENKYIRNLPIRIIDLGIEKERINYETILQLVVQILSAKKQLQQAKTESDKDYLQRKCDSIDKQIDQLVYQLYGLTDEEIKIVEGG